MYQVKDEEIQRAVDLVVKGHCNRVDLHDGAVKVYSTKNVVRIDLRISDNDGQNN